MEKVTYHIIGGIVGDLDFKFGLPTFGKGEMPFWWIITRDDWL